MKKVPLSALCFTGLLASCNKKDTISPSAQQPVQTTTHSKLATPQITNSTKVALGELPYQAYLGLEWCALWRKYY